MSCQCPANIIDVIVVVLAFYGFVFVVSKIFGLPL